MLWDVIEFDEDWEVELKEISDWEVKDTGEVVDDSNEDVVPIEEVWEPEVTCEVVIGIDVDIDAIEVDICEFEVNGRDEEVCWTPDVIIAEVIGEVVPSWPVVVAIQEIVTLSNKISALEYVLP